MDGPRAIQLKALKMWSETVDYERKNGEHISGHRVLIHHNSGSFATKK